ncbi:MAG: sugar ABC transporter permease, partial [Christensenella sp.]|nr:sugar ABC transporter permease [Christensenella sp.]
MGKGEARAARAFLAPSLIGIFVLVLIPTADVIRRSFFSAMGDQFVGLENYKTIFENASFQLAVHNTIRFLLVCIPLLLLFSLAAALLLYRRIRFQNLFRTTYLLPLVVPVTSVVMIIQTVFHKNGLLSALSVALGSTPTDWLNSEYAFWVLVLCYLWKYFGYNVILWLAGLSAISDSYYEAARVDGANEMQCFFHITLPQLGGTLFITSVLSLINSFKVFREAYLVAGRYPNNSIYMLQHVLSNWFSNLDMQKISA